MARADTLVIPGGTPESPGTPQQVTFVDFQDNKLIYPDPGRRPEMTGRLSGSRISLSTVKHPSTKPRPLYGDIRTIKRSMVTSKPSAAPPKPWLRLFAAKRLLAAIGNDNRFDARVVAYITMLAINPDNAAGYKPDLPATGNKQLDAAVADTETALKQPSLGAPQTLALYNFLLDLHRQRKDDSATTQTLERLNRLSSTLGDLPEVRQQLASVKVHQAPERAGAEEIRRGDQDHHRQPPGHHRPARAGRCVVCPGAGEAPIRRRR